MAPGRRRDPLGDLALDHEHEPLRPRLGSPRTVWRMGLVMWYGRLATTSYGGGQSRVTVRSRTSSSTSRSVPAAAGSVARRSIASRSRSARCAASRWSSSTAVTGRPGREQAAGQDAEARPDLEDALARRHGRASVRIASRTSASARWFWLRACARPRRAGAGSAHASGREVRRRRGSDAPASTGPDRERQRGSRVEVEAGPRRRPRSGAQPAAPIIAALSVHRPGRGTTSGSPCRGRVGRAGSRRTALAATPPPRTIDRAADLAGGPQRLRRQHVDDRRPGSPRRARRPPRRDSRRLRIVGRQALVGAGGRRPPGGRRS